MYLRFFLLITLLMITSIARASDFNERTCPTFVRIPPVVELNGADAKEIEWVIPIIADNLPMKIKAGSLRVITPALLQYATQKSTATDSDYFKNLSRVDFAVVIKWQKILDIKNVLTLRLVNHDGDILDTRSMDVDYLKNQTNEIRDFVRDAGQSYGALLTDLFYCIRITPSDVKISASETQEFTVQVQNLKGTPISGENVTFNLSDVGAGDIKPNQTTLVNGQAKITYQVKKPLNNTLSAAIQPKSLAAEKSETLAKIGVG